MEDMKTLWGATFEEDARFEIMRGHTLYENPWKICEKDEEGDSVFHNVNETDNIHPEKCG